MKVAKMLINNDDIFYEDDMVIVVEGLHKAESVIGKVIYFSENTYTGRIYNIDTVQNEIVLDMSDKYRTKTKTISVENIIDIKKIA